MKGAHYFVVAFAGIATLGAIAYYLERQGRAELDQAVTDAFKVGGWLTGFFPDQSPQSTVNTPTGKYANPTKEV
jgi:hypothetical protein